MKTGRRGFFGAIASAFAGVGVAAAAETVPALQGLAFSPGKLKLRDDIRTDFRGYAGIGDDPKSLLGPRRDYTTGAPLKTGTKADALEARAARAAQIERDLQQPYIGVDAAGNLTPFYDDKAIAEAVTRALQSGAAPGLREALRNL